MQKVENRLEVLLRLIRDEKPGRSSSNSSQAHSVASLARSLEAPYPQLQNNLSLATFSLFKLAMEIAETSGTGRDMVERRVGDIIRALPYHLVFKSLDSMAKESIC